MNLLPRSHEEFSQKEYWDNFFKKRGNKAFEWYGEYAELCDHLHKYIKIKDDVLIVGCGNSSLGNDLYDIGYKNITSIDISQVAIRQMKNLNEKKRPNLKFIQMDALNMEFESETFSAIIDKGTLDALMPNNNPETISTIFKYLDEILRTLKTGGRYLCISLLQEHIMKILLEYFPKNNCMFRVVRCYQAEKSAALAGESAIMPVFLIVCTKFKNLNTKVLEINLGATDKMQRIATEDEIIQQLLAVQHSAFICSGLKRTNNADDNDITFDLFKSGSEVPRYTVYVVDIEPTRKNMQYATFIVPQGRESEWLFSTKEGRKQLTVMSKCNRLAVVTMHREQTYENLDRVKEELTEVVRNLAPATIGNEKILFLSLGSDVGSRKVCYKGNSKFSGDYIVEDVEIDEEKYRRLYYLNSRLVIQSEAKLKSIKSKSGKSKEIIDLTYLTCEHHIPMSQAVHIVATKVRDPKISIIGLGGGSLCSFIRKFLPNVHVTAIDIDDDMLKVAKDWFGLNIDDKLNVQILDGIEYLQKESNAGSKLDAILFDVDSKDNTIGMSCPPKEFISESTLTNVHSLLKRSGLFILNVVLRDVSLRLDILKCLSNKFHTVASIKLEKDLNEIFICTAGKTSQDNLNNLFNEATKEINKFFSKHNNKTLCIDGGGNVLKFCKMDDK